MPKKHKSPQSLFLAQQARFAAVRGNSAAMLALMEKEGKKALDDMVKGSGPSGKARIKALRAAGHPFGRRDSALDRNGMRFGSMRGTKGMQGQAALKGWKTPPVGMISGRLKSSTFVTTNGYKMTLGFNSKAESSIYRVIPGGTNKMVDAGIWAPGEGGALGKRMKSLRLAMRKGFFDPLYKP